ncbi:MAG: sirohydrochlorin nickelochelatase [Methanobacterium sp.]
MSNEYNLDSKGTDTGILLVGHGSRLTYSKEVICNLAEMYRENSEYLVEVGFMNMDKPSIPAAINKLGKKRVNKIIVIPVFIAHGIHTKHDIPHILGLDNDHKYSHNHHEEVHEKIEFNGEIIYTEPFGADQRLVEIIKDKVINAKPKLRNNHKSSLVNIN